MNIDYYHNQQIIGWLSYNPNFESRHDGNTDNRVCYIYPRFLLINGRYQTIDSHQDFPQVGRLQVRIQGQLNAEDVYKRFGPIVSCRLNTVPQANYEANNYYAVRFNPQMGRDRSEIWIDRIDGNAFYQIINISQSINDIIRFPEVEMPFGLATLCSNNILLSCQDGRLYGPFDVDFKGGLLKLHGLERFDYMVGSFPYIGGKGALESSVLTFLDQNDSPSIEVLPTNKLPSPYSADENYDMIDQNHLIDTFLDQAKTQLNYSRNEFRDLKAYCDQVLSGQEKLSVTEERFNRLRVLLPRLFNQDSMYRELIELTLNNDSFREHLIKDIMDSNGERLLNTLPKSVVNEVKAAVRNKVASTISSTQQQQQQAQPAPEPAPVKNIDDFNFLLNKDVKSSIENIANESDSTLAHLNVICSNVAFIGDHDADQETIQGKKEMHPENIMHEMHVARMLSGFLNNLSRIINEALDSNLIKNDNKLTRDYTNLSQRLLQLHSSIEDQCLRLQRSDKLKQYYNDFPDVAAVATVHANMVNTKGKGANGNNINNRNAASDKKSSGPTLPAATPNTSEVELLRNQISNMQHELDRYKQLTQTSESLNSLQQQLQNVQKSLDDKDTLLKVVTKQITEKQELAAQITKKLQENVAQYQDKAAAALRLIDTNIIGSVLGMNLGGDLAAGNYAGLSGSEAEAAAAVAAGTATDNMAPATDSKAAGGADAAAAASAQALNKAVPAFNTALLAQPNQVAAASQIIDNIGNYINDVGNRNLSHNDIANYLICLSQGFITTFAGEPGTGKTSLCNLLGRALGLVQPQAAGAPNTSRFTEVAVERGWTSLKDFIGYYNPLTKRMEKSNAEVFDAFVAMNKEAQFAPDGGEYDPRKIAPYIILLDEANLSPIEHYWAAFFRNCDFNSPSRRSISLGGNANWLLPEHLRFLATVNFDHTTEELSSRFLDRSWVITLEPTSIQTDIEDTPNKTMPMMPFASLINAFTPQAGTKLESSIEDKWQIIQDIFASEECALPIRPRNLMMVNNYCVVAQKCMERNNQSTKLAPLDYAVAQKILPTINGTGERYMHLVENLLQECNAESMPLCAKHLKRIQRNGGADLGFYQFFAR